jgi:hypothetical protein
VDVKIGVISSGGISSQIKVDIAFPTQMTEQWDVECVMNAMHHATWKEVHGRPLAP